MSKEELKPIDVSKYTVTENGNVIKSEELKSERIEALREKLRTELNEWWKKTFDVKREDDVCQVIKTKEAEDLCFDIALPREMQIDILSQHILELQADKGNLTDRVKELEAQIEQMKCCGNCKNLKGRFDSKTNINILYCSDSDMKQIEVGFQMCCCKWEIKEK